MAGGGFVLELVVCYFSINSSRLWLVTIRIIVFLGIIHTTVDKILFFISY